MTTPTALSQVEALTLVAAAAVSLGPQPLDQTEEEWLRRLTERTGLLRDTATALQRHSASIIKRVEITGTLHVPAQQNNHVRVRYEITCPGARHTDSLWTDPSEGVDEALERLRRLEGQQVTAMKVTTAKTFDAQGQPTELWSHAEWLRPASPASREAEKIPEALAKRSLVEAYQRRGLSGVEAVQHAAESWRAAGITTGEDGFVEDDALRQLLDAADSMLPCDDEVIHPHASTPGGGLQVS